MYTQTLRFWSVKEKQIVEKKTTFLLPHEIIGTLVEAGQEAVLTECSALDETNKRSMRPSSPRKKSHL